jgi:hypothetical protein
LITQLSLSANTVRNLRSINPNISHAIEWIIRLSMTDGYSSPYAVSDRSPKQVVSTNLSPYGIGILQDFGSFGLNPSQVVEWLAKVYTETEPVKPIVSKMVVKKKIKQSKQPVKQPVKQSREKPAFVHTQESGPLVKKVTKLKPTR